MFSQDYKDDDFTRYYSDDEESYYAEGGAGTTAGEKKSKGKNYPPEEEKKRVGFCGKAFSHLFPKTQKLCYTKQGQWLRWMAFCAVLNHCAFFIFSLYFVGFGSTITNLLFAFFSYSNALTLRKRQFVLYLCALFIAGTCELIYDLEKKVDSM